MNRESFYHYTISELSKIKRENWKFLGLSFMYIRPLGEKDTEWAMYILNMEMKYFDSIAGYFGRNYT